MAKLTIQPAFIKATGNLLAAAIFSDVVDQITKGDTGAIDINDAATSYGASPDDVAEALECLSEKGFFAKPPHPWAMIGSFAPVKIAVGLSYGQLRLPKAAPATPNDNLRKRLCPGIDPLAIRGQEYKAEVKNEEGTITLTVTRTADQFIVCDGMEFETGDEAWEWVDEWEKAQLELVAILEWAEGLGHSPDQDVIFLSPNSYELVVDAAYNFGYIEALDASNEELCQDDRRAKAYETEDFRMGGRLYQRLDVGGNEYQPVEVEETETPSVLAQIHQLVVNNILPQQELTPLAPLSLKALAAEINDLDERKETDEELHRQCLADRGIKTLSYSLSYAHGETQPQVVQLWIEWTDGVKLETTFDLDAENGFPLDGYEEPAPAFERKPEYTIGETTYQVTVTPYIPYDPLGDDGSGTPAKERFKLTIIEGTLIVLGEVDLESEDEAWSEVEKFLATREDATQDLAAQAESLEPESTESTTSTNGKATNGQTKGKAARTRKAVGV
jgi:hypothetical protein